MSKAPLHDEPTERALIGATTLDPALVSRLMHVVSDDFADPRRSAIWEGIREMGGATFSISSLAAKMGDRCTNAAREELRTIEESTFTSEGSTELADRLQALATRRRIARAATRLLEATGNPTLGADDLMAKAHSEILEATARGGRSRPMTYQEVMVATTEFIQNNIGADGGLTGTTTGIKGLDGFTSGMHPGELWILAARPGRGKTAVAMLVADAVARAHGPVAFASLEMPLSQLGVRAIARSSGVYQSKIRRGQFTEHDLKGIGAAFEDLHALPIMAWDEGSIGLTDLRSLALQTRARFGGLACVVVDYLQLMRGDKSDSREQEIAGIARGLKMLSKELHVPILSLAQLSRKNETEKRRPVLSDLRESGAIEQDADTVLFLHSESMEETLDGKLDVELIIAKQRNGPRASVELQFHGATMRYEESAK